MLTGGKKLQILANSWVIGTPGPLAGAIHTPETAETGRVFTQSVIGGFAGAAPSRSDEAQGVHQEQPGVLVADGEDRLIQRGLLEDLVHQQAVRSAGGVH